MGAEAAVIATTKFREQHDDLLGVAADLSAVLNAARLAEDARAARALVTRLLGKLSVHLVMEDKVLYPRLVDHEDAGIRSLAARFTAEMGGITDSLERYKSKWISARAIQQEASVFVVETRALLDSLKRRIEKENNQLYRAVDGLP